MARGSKIWFNGKIASAESTRISLFTHALHYGMGAFEGIRCYRQSNGGGAVFRLHEHIQRLDETIKILSFKMPFSREKLVQACLETIRANDFEECYIRPIAFVGDGPLGVDPGANPPIDVAILTWEWGSYLGDEGLNNGAKLKISSFIRPHVNSIMTKGKITGQYVTGVIAKREAVSQGYSEALFLDPQGYLSEGSGENLFLIKEGLIKTTPLTSILGGITRKTVIAHLRAKGLTVKEQLFTRDELWCADEVFLCGTAAEITPVQSIDDREIGTGKPGPLTAELQKEYMAMVRGDLPPYGKNWLTPLN